MASKEVHIETDSLYALIEEIDCAVHDLLMRRSLTVETEDGRDARNDPDKARLARTTLRAADLALLLSGELHQRYWQIKGNDDPRENP